jgi:hypothetical protein
LLKKSERRGRDDVQDLVVLEAELPKAIERSSAVTAAASPTTFSASSIAARSTSSRPADPESRTIARSSSAPSGSL